MISKPLLKIFSIIVFFSFSLSGLAGSHIINRNTQMTSGNILYVGGNGPGNYTNITNAYNDAINGDTIYVFPGIYNEGQLEINKTISILGQNKHTTIINNTHLGLISNNITLTSFTIQYGSLGIGLDEYAEGYISVINNIFNRTITVTLGSANHNYVANNSFINCGLFIPFIGENLLTFTNTIINNTINDKPLIYLEDTRNQIINNAGQIILLRCKNITIKECFFRYLFTWTQISSSENITIENSEFNDQIIWLYQVKNSKIKANYLYNYSLIFFQKCYDNIIINNILVGEVPLFLEDSSNNIFFENDFKKRFGLIGLSDIVGYNSHNYWYRNYWGRPRILPKILWIMHISYDNPSFGFWSFDIDFRPSILPNNNPKIIAQNRQIPTNTETVNQIEILERIYPTILSEKINIVPNAFFKTQ